MLLLCAHLHSLKKYLSCLLILIKLNFTINKSGTFVLKEKASKLRLGLELKAGLSDGLTTF